MAPTLPVTPNEVTDVDIEDLVGRFRLALQKHRPELLPGVLGRMLRVEGLVTECLAPLRQQLPAVVKNPVRRKFSVERTRTLQEALDATGFEQEIFQADLDAAPRNGAWGGEMVFFQVRREYLTHNEMTIQYALRGLWPADLLSLAAVNGAEPGFCATKPNCTHWQNDQGEWCYAAFSQFGAVDNRLVVVNSNDGFDGYWWFAGIER